MNKCENIHMQYHDSTIPYFTIKLGLIKYKALMIASMNFYYNEINCEA